MKWIITLNSGVKLSKPNEQYLVFDTSDDAMNHIKENCNNSPYLKPQKLIKRNI